MKSIQLPLLRVFFFCFFFLFFFYILYRVKCATHLLIFFLFMLEKKQSNDFISI